MTCLLKLGLWIALASACWPAENDVIMRELSAVRLEHSIIMKENAEIRAELNSKDMSRVALVEKRLDLLEQHELSAMKDHDDLMNKAWQLGVGLILLLAGSGASIIMGYLRGVKHTKQLKTLANQTDGMTTRLELLSREKGQGEGLAAGIVEGRRQEAAEEDKRG